MITITKARKKENLESEWRRTDKVEVHILRAFVNTEGQFGNPTGIILDVEQNLTSHDRQRIATELHFTDTVFINKLETVDVSFYNPQQETKFAGDAIISTSYLLKHLLDKNNCAIHCKVGQVSTWAEGELTWIEASVTGTPGWIHKQLESPSAVNVITEEEAAQFEHTMV
jgi:PhzF family phenazine biosynthesis protein